MYGVPIAHGLHRHPVRRPGLGRRDLRHPHLLRPAVPQERHDRRDDARDLVGQHRRHQHRRRQLVPALADPRRGLLRPPARLVVSVPAGDGAAACLAQRCGGLACVVVGLRLGLRLGCVLYEYYLCV